MKLCIKKYTLLALVLSITVLFTACSSIGAEIKLTNKNSEKNEVLVKNTYIPKQLPCQVGISEDTDEDDIFNYSEIARNSNSILYADMNNGHFALQDISTEKIWYSIPNNLELDEITGGTNRSEVRSELLVNYVLKEEERVSKSYKTEASSTLKEENKKIEAIENGLRVTYTFKKSDITVPVEYTLTNDTFRAEIITKDIVETETAYLISVNLLPVFGAGAWNEGGYVFVPDGSGAIIDFSYHNDMENGYIKEVYGKEKAIMSEFNLPSEDIKLPVFATVAGNNTLMGNIIKGDTASSISAIYHSDNYGYTSVCGVLDYRIIDVKTMFENYPASIRRTNYRVSKLHADDGGYVVEYSLLNGDKSNYVGVAEKYREYLTENGKLNKTESKPKFNIEVYGAVDINTSFLGINYNTTEILTTVNQAKEISENLKKSGISDIALRYIGFSGSGILNKKLNTSVKPKSKIGNLDDMKSLAAYVELYPDYDLMQVRKSGNGVSFNKDVIRTVFNYKAEQNTFSRSIYIKLSEEEIYLLNGRGILGAAEKLLKKYTEYENISLSSIGNMLYSDFSENGGLYKDKTALYIEEALNKISKESKLLALEDANAYTFKYVDKIWSAPTYSSSFDIFKTDVPFYQIVLHSNIPLTSAPIIQSQNPEVQVLKAIETGNELMFAATYKDSSKLLGTRYEKLYSTGYTNWIDYATAIYKDYQPLLEKIYNKKIVNHYEYEDGVFITEYENSIAVAVNYNDYSVNVNSIEVDGMSYKVIKGGETNEIKKD